MSRNQIASRLADAGRRRAEAIQARDDASQEIAKLIPRAQRAGIGVTEIARLTGLSRRAVYDLIGDE